MPDFELLDDDAPADAEPPGDVPDSPKNDTVDEEPPEN